MNYDEVRSQIKSGDILAFSTSGWDTYKHVVAQIIRIFTRSEYNHMAVAYWQGGRLMVIEAIYPEVRIYPLSNKGDFFWIPMELPWTPEAEKFALAQVGDKYSVLHAIMAYFGHPPRQNQWECAEFAQAVAEKEGLVLKSDPTPSKIVRELQELGKSVIFIKNPG